MSVWRPESLYPAVVPRCRPLVLLLHSDHFQHADVYVTSTANKQDVGLLIGKYQQYLIFASVDSFDGTIDDGSHGM